MSGKRVEFIELGFPVTETFNMTDRDDIEESLDIALAELGMGYISGAGGTLGENVVLELAIDISEDFQTQPDRVKETIFDLLKGFSLPSGCTCWLYPLAEFKVFNGEVWHDRKG